MLRVTGHCLLLLILASCGGYIVNSGIGKEDPSSVLWETVELPSLKNILHPVPLSDLKKQLKHTKNYYDFVRIFLTKKDIPNKVIDDFVNARTIQKIQRNLNDDDDYDEDDYMADGEEEQDRLDEELTEALYHQEEMLLSPLGECKTPQPEIITVLDHENKNRIYLPECTVVYRCRNVTGCCGSTNRECGPLKIQVIERAFIVVDLFNDDQAFPGRDLVEKRVFINHTECGCREKQGLQNCDKFRCPFPFTMMRRGIECSCDCQQFANENNYLCQGIKDGVIPLMETDLACIKGGDCLKPVCTRGTLHVQSGHCPAIPIDEIRYQETRIEKEKNRHIRHHKHNERPLKERELEESDVDDIEAGLKAEVEGELEPKPQVETMVESKAKLQVETLVESKVKPHVEILVESQVKPDFETLVESHAKPDVETLVESQGKPHVETLVESQMKTEILEQGEEPIEAKVGTVNVTELLPQNVTNINSNSSGNVTDFANANLDQDADSESGAHADVNMDSGSHVNRDEDDDVGPGKEVNVDARVHTDRDSLKHKGVDNDHRRRRNKGKKHKDAFLHKPAKKS